MSIQQQPQGFSGPPSSIERPVDVAGVHGDTTGVSPLGAARNVKKRMPLGASAGGGLVLGLVAGLILIGGGDSKKAEASKEAEIVAKAETPKAPKTLGQLAEDDGVAPKTEAGEPAVEPTKPAEAATADPSATESAPETPATAEPAVVQPAAPAPAAPEPVVPEPEPIDVSLQFDVTGLEAGVEATITVNGKPVTGTSAPLVIPAGKKSMKAKLVVKAKGYRGFRKTLTVTEDASIPVAMRKKPAGGPRKKAGGPGGLLDL